MNNPEAEELKLKAKAFLDAAEIVNGRGKSLADVAYYLLSHAVELSIKAVVMGRTGKSAERVHDKEDLSEKFKILCGISNEDLLVIKKLKDLNNGVGGLRYPNEVIGRFDHELFSAAVLVARSILEQLNTCPYR